jgi:hypothetical protein
MGLRRLILLIVVGVVVAIIARAQAAEPAFAMIF